MGRTSIVPENRISSDTERFAAFKLSQTGERARIACLEREQRPDGTNVLVPWMEWVHRIEGVEEKDGQPLQKERKWKSKDGTENSEMVWSTDWIGSPLCLGDKAILMEKGLDPANCPVCAASQTHPEITQNRGFGAPVVRYAMNIVRFSTRPGGFILADPFGAQIVVWSFTEKRFNRLDDLNLKLAERGEIQFRKGDGTIGVRPYDITDVDLLLGPCEDHRMQKYEIDLAEGMAMWRRSQPTISYIQQLWLGAGMRATDEQLQLACGKPVTNRGYLDSDIQKAVVSWNKALRGGPAPTVDPFGASFGGQQASQDMQTGMTDMLGQLATPPVPGAGVPQVTQPSVAPVQVPAVQPAQVPAQPQEVPQVAQPTVQPTPPGPPPPVAQEMPPAPPTPEQMQAAAGGAGLEQFAPMPPTPAPLQPQTALQQAVAPELAALQAAQMQALQNAGVPVPPTPAVPAAVPSAPVSTVPPTGTSMTPPTPQPPTPAPPAAPEVPDLFAPPVAATPAPEGQALEFDALAQF